MNKKRIMAIVVAVSLVIGSVNFYVFDVWDKITESYTLSNRDRTMAEDLASMTGKSVDNLMNLKSKSGSWNSVVDNLNKDNEYEKITDEELQDLLDGESFAESEISEVKMLVEQIVFNLNEISRDLSPITAEVSPTKVEKDDDKTEEYKKIGQAFDKNLAIYLALKLQGKLGSIQAVIDEYLYCLQIEVDLRLLLTDEEVYEKTVLEKSAELMRSEAITADDISACMLETFKPQKVENTKDDDKLPKAKDNEAIVMPDNIAPQDPRPQDPTKGIMDEIDKINQSWR